MRGHYQRPALLLFAAGSDADGERAAFTVAILARGMPFGSEVLREGLRVSSTPASLRFWIHSRFGIQDMGFLHNDKS